MPTSATTLRESRGNCSVRGVSWGSGLAAVWARTYLSVSLSTRKPYHMGFLSLKETEGRSTGSASTTARAAWQPHRPLFGKGLGGGPKRVVKAWVLPLTRRALRVDLSPLRGARWGGRFAGRGGATTVLRGARWGGAARGRGAR